MMLLGYPNLFKPPSSIVLKCALGCIMCSSVSQLSTDGPLKKIHQAQIHVLQAIHRPLFTGPQLSLLYLSLSRIPLLVYIFLQVQQKELKPLSLSLWKPQWTKKIWDLLKSVLKSRVSVQDEFYSRQDYRWLKKKSNKYQEKQLSLYDLSYLLIMNNY